MLKEQPRAACQPSRKHPVFRLAMTKQVLCNHPQLTSQMLRMQQTNSWSSELPSSTKSLMQHPPTTLMHGESTSMQQVYKTNTQTYPTAFSLVSMQAFDPSPTCSPHQTDLLSPNIELNLIKLYRLNFRRDATLALSPERKLKPYSAPSKHHHSALYQSLDSQESLESFKTCPTHTPHRAPSPPSTAQLTQTYTLAHGVLLPLSAYSFGASPQGRKQQSVTLRRPTGQSPSSQISGRDLSSAWMKITTLRLTHETVSASPQGVALMASWVMLGPKSCAPMALALSQNGLMTTSSSRFCIITLKNTTSTMNNGHAASRRMGERFTMEAASGSEVTPCQTTSLKNLTKTYLLLSKIFHRHLKGSCCSTCTSSLACTTNSLLTQIGRSHEDEQFTYCMADIDVLSNDLGIPWETGKDLPFSDVTPFIGFSWDLTNRTVSLPESKKAKYLQAIQEWESKLKHTLEEVQKLYSKLLHACHIVPARHAYLTNLEAFMGTCHRDSPFCPCFPPRRTLGNLLW